jgi:hypothetical protein
MLVVEIQIPTKANTIIEVVERVYLDAQLTCTLKGTLKSYPGSIHWHYQKKREKGTLEITWWEKKNRLWFKVADGRIGPWIIETLPQLKTEIEKSLQ